jgi:hypothetical protein
MVIASPGFLYFRKAAFTLPFLAWKKLVQSFHHIHNMRARDPIKSVPPAPLKGHKASVY